jgi:hypothetical protein
MDGTNVLKETTRATAPVASNALSVNVFTAPGHRSCEIRIRQSVAARLPIISYSS